MKDLLGKNKNVLIVEDDLIISLVIEKMIFELGYKVVGKTETGEEAVEMALKLKPDLILMDIRLKGEMDGIDAVNQINQKIDTSIIYVTGNSDNAYLQRIKKTKHVDLIIKPFTSNDLRQSLDLLD